MSSKYVVDTGPGYLGIVSISPGSDGGLSASISPSDMSAIGVGSGEEVGVDARSDRIVIRLLAGRVTSDEEKSRQTTKDGGGWRRKSGVLGLYKSLESLPVAVGDSVRIYKREDPERLVVVPRDADPFLDEEGRA